MIGYALTAFALILAGAEILQQHHELAAAFFAVAGLFYIGTRIYFLHQGVVKALQDLGTMMLADMACRAGITSEEVRKHFAQKESEEDQEAETNDD